MRERIYVGKFNIYIYVLKKKPSPQENNWQRIGIFMLSSD